MRRAIVRLALAGATVLMAHSFAYLLMRTLPDAAVVALGLEALRDTSVSAFKARHVLRPYGHVLADLARGELGTSLDGVPVLAELTMAVGESAPRLILAAGLALLVSLALPLWPAWGRAQHRQVAGFVGFLPPYVAPFCAIGILRVLVLRAGLGVGDLATQAAAVLATACVPAAIVLSQTTAVMEAHLRSEHGRTLRALGATPAQQRFQLIPNVWFELLPSTQKMLIALLANLIFVEPLFGLPGFGSTVVRAVRRSDADLILGVVLAVAVVTAGISALTQRTATAKGA